MQMNLAVRLLFLAACFASVAWGGWARQRLDDQEPLSCLDQVASYLRNTPAIGVGQMLSFDLADLGPPGQHVAVLGVDFQSVSSRLRIFRCAGHSVETAFTLVEPGGERWETIESFPSNGLVPGVVIWGGSDYARTELIVVCYTGSYSYLPSGERVEKPGIFKVAFKGDDAMLVDLDLDGIPEVVANAYSARVDVWTYIAGAYVKVGTFPKEALWSDAVRKAIEGTKRKHDAAGGATGKGPRLRETK